MDESVRILFGDNLSSLAANLPQGAGRFVLYDRNVAGFAEAIFSDSTPVSSKAIVASETAKTPETVLEICEWLLQAGADRESVLICIGGGITTDIGGFAASVFKRGIRYVNVPTTLLAQVDAGIGGKTGVNFGGYKNMLGTITQPLFTFICPETLRTLPKRQFIGGAAELLKTFLIDNEGAAYETAVKRLAAGENLGDLPFKAAEIKAAIVRRDPYEHGVRTKLNLGHTFAHAIEHLSAGGGPSHGEAVAMGIILAARLSDRLGIGPSPLETHLKEDFIKAGLPVECPYSPSELCGAMALDKKASGGLVRFVLPRAVGDVIIYPMAVEKAVSILEGGRL